MQYKIKATDLFYLFFYLNVFCKGIGLSNDSSFYKILLVLGILVLGIKYMTTLYSKKDLFKVIFLCVTGILSFLVTRKPTIMLTCLCLAGIKGIDIERLFRGTYRIRLWTFISVVGLSLLGVIENTSIKMWRNGHFDVRYSLGFGHPNSLHLAFFILVATFLYVNFYQMYLLKYAMIIIANYFVYKFSGSRTGFFGVLLLIVIIYLSHLQSYRVKRIICVLPKYVLILLMLASFILAWLYGKVPFVTALDSAFNGRLSYSNHFIMNYGVSIFGHSLVNENALFDNGYLFLYVQFGVMGTLLIVGFIYMICKNVECNMDVRKAALVLAFLVYIFTESFSPNIFMNVILIFVGPLLYNETQRDMETTYKIFVSN